MNIRKYIFSLTLALVAVYGCSNDDDDNGIVVIELRDLAEQQADEVPIIESYLKTHFYDFIDNPANSDYKITVFDTIAGDNSDKTPIWESELLTSKTITVDNNDEKVDHTLYILKQRIGASSERQPRFADSTLVTYRGELFYDNEDKDGDGINDLADVDADADGVDDIDKESDGVETTRVDTDNDGIRDQADVDSNPDAPDMDSDGIIDAFDTVDNMDTNRRVFDSRVTPVWLDLMNPTLGPTAEGFREAIVDFRGASGFTVNNDGTVSYNMDFGNYTVFMPSGLGYFGNVQPSIPIYSSLIFTVQLYASEETDHDGDGVPSYLEDIDGDRLVFDSDDDTDGDGTPDYIDTDDDGDGTLTEDEDLEADQDLDVDRDGDGDATNDLGDGNPMNDDTDGDGIPNYLDTDNEESRDD